MPNHVTNIIELNGDKLEIKNLLETIKNDEIGLGSIDFEKIIPMPDNIYRGDLGSKERELYGQILIQCLCIDIKNNNPKEKITFLTAWAAPHPIMEKLAEMYPEVNIQHEWADEDIGMNCGRYCYSKGERVEEYFPEAQKDRIE